MSPECSNYKCNHQFTITTLRVRCELTAQLGGPEPWRIKAGFIYFKNCIAQIFLAEILRFLFTVHPMRLVAYLPIPKFAPLFTTPARYLVLGGMAWEETLAESCSSWWQVHVFQDAMNFRKSGLFEIDIIHLSMPVWDYKVETVLKDIWDYQARVQWHFTIWKPT